MLHSEQKELQSCNYYYFFLKEEHLNSICSAFEDFLSMSKYVKKSIIFNIEICLLQIINPNFQSKNVEKHYLM